MFDGVVQHVDNREADEHSVGPHDVIGVAIDVDRGARLVREDLDQGRGLTDQVDEREYRGRYLRSSGLGSGHHQESVDQLGQAARLLEHAPDDFSVGLGGTGVLEANFAHAPNRRQGCAQLVRDVAAELPELVERGGEARQEVIEYARDLPELIVGIVDRQSLVQAMRSYAFGLGGHTGEWVQCVTHQIAAGERRGDECEGQHEPFGRSMWR
jgi:hypothetical protein